MKNLRICALTLLLLLSAATLSAQKDVKKYRQESDIIRKEVWSWNKPEFEVRTVPAEFAGASRVVIARHMEINSDSKKKTQFTGLGFTMYRELTLTEIAREAVKLNDKSAVADYSEFSFTQLQRRSGFFMDQTTTMYIGVKVIKPDGSVKEVNADDIVLTRNDKREKEAKVAIPDLQPGDIVDYFIAKQTSMSQTGTENISSFTFTFYDESPLLHYSIHCEIGKKYAVEYRAYNGAPDLKHTKGEDDAIILDAVRKNIPAFPENNFWVSPYRQLPLIRMNIMVGYKGVYANRLNARKPGEVYKNQPADEFVEDEINALAMAKYNSIKMRSMSGLDAIGADYVRKMKKQRKSIPLDSLAAEIYYAYRFDKFLDIWANTDISKVINRAHSDFSHSGFLFEMGMFLKKADVDNKLVLLTSRYGPDMKNIMSKDDIAYALLIEGSKPRIFGITDMFSPAYYVPPYYEHTKQAITLDMGSYSDINPKSFEKGTINIPGTAAAHNARIEQLHIRPNTDGSTVNVKRRTTLRGHYKPETQKALVLFEDYYEAERILLGGEKSLVEQFAERRKSKKYADELQAAFAEARQKQKTAFIDEARGWYEQEVTDLKDYKIENLGVRHNNPDFIYSAEFNLGGLMKKAGNNLIFEIGKLQGTPLKVEDDQRKRSLDIYAPFARSIQYQVTLDIPEGYEVEGVSNLARKVDNVSGSFIVDAVTEGRQVKIKVTKSYRNAYEPTGNWINLLAFIDASNEWTGAKLLFRKK